MTRALKEDLLDRHRGYMDRVKISVPENRCVVVLILTGRSEIFSLPSSFASYNTEEMLGSLEP